MLRGAFHGILTPYHIPSEVMIMAPKRRDNKGRILQIGEWQEPNGRYRYMYNDALGKRKIVYSWRLTEADPVPAHRRKDIPLREKEKQVMSLFMQGISGSDMTVVELVERYISLKSGVKQSTLANYKTVINNLKKTEFAYRHVDQVKLSDAKMFLISLQRNGLGYSSIHNIRGVLRPAFQMAVDDDMILKNPFDFEMGTVINNDSNKREAISPQDEKRFMDFDEEVINVDHQLQRSRNMKYYIESTKTTSGTRKIPMTEEVKELCQRIVANRNRPKREPIIDGYGGFLFFDKEGKPMVALHWEKYMQHAREKYNREHALQLPPITPHVCRHTFCSNMAREGINPKTLQYLMGHSDIAVTMNVYTHLGLDDARVELARLKEAKNELKFKKII